MDYFSLIISRRKQRAGDSAKIVDGPAISDENRTGSRYSSDQSPHSAEAVFFALNKKK
jgi:hypothetical protein